MEVATSVVLAGEAGLTLDDRVRGAGQVGRTSHQFRDLLADGIDDNARRGSTRNVAVLCCEGWDCLFPSFRQLTAQAALKLRLQT